MKNKQISILWFLSFIACILLSGCLDIDNKSDADDKRLDILQVTTESNAIEQLTEVGISERPDEPNSEIESESETETQEIKSLVELSTEENPRNEIIISLDPGHQSENVDMSEMEPNAPDSDELKAKATSGTEGRFTGVPEYKLNLDIALRVRDRLIELGYVVIMTREDNDTAISNMERACMANEAGADISIRIHANGCEDSSVSGALALIGSESNPYVGDLYMDSHKLAESVLSEYTKATGLPNQGVRTDDSMTGINWSKIPVIILEMGYMTNEYDDKSMQDPEFQDKMVDGIVNGIELYYGFDTEKDKVHDQNNISEIELSEESIKLKGEIERIIQEVRYEGGSCSVYLKNLSTGEVITFSDGKQKAASIIKLFIAGAVYNHSKEFSDLGYTEEMIELLVEKMISESDNDAANELVMMLGSYDAEIGMQIVNSYIESFGYENTRQRRLMLDFDSTEENYVDACEVGDYLEKLYHNEVEGSDKIISYMKRQKYTEKIPSVLPEEVLVANKTGDLVGTENDAAIVYGKKSDYVICIFIDELYNPELSINTFKRISAEVYNSWE